jgi:DNA-binding XRE family transcriptional regulator
MPVYMIRAGENGPVKIGHSQWPEVRLGQLQISHWERLRIIRVFEGGESEEAILHARFADLHIRGEWHSFSRLMLADVGLVEVVDAVPEIAPPENVSTPQTPLNLGKRVFDLRKARGVTQAELAAALNVSRVAITMIETGRDMPGRELLWRMTRYFGVPFIEFDATRAAISA